MNALSPETRELLRTNLLLQAEAVGTHGLSDGAYLIGATAQGFRVDGEMIACEVDYLADKGFLTRVPKALSPEIRKHRITAEGRDWLAEHA